MPPANIGRGFSNYRENIWHFWGTRLTSTGVHRVRAFDFVLDIEDECRGHRRLSRLKLSTGRRFVASGQVCPPNFCCCDITCNTHVDLSTLVRALLFLLAAQMPFPTRLCGVFLLRAIRHLSNATTVSTAGMFEKDVPAFRDSMAHQVRAARVPRVRGMPHVAAASRAQPHATASYSPGHDLKPAACARVE